MPTAACGINCDVCGLRLLGICSSCGSGISQEAINKIEAQKRLFGKPCPVLACAQMNHIQFCLRDCQSFPCENFRAGPYPLSEGYLNMQERRRKQKPPGRTPKRDLIKIPPEYWGDLKKKGIEKLCELSLSTPHLPEGILMRFLKDDILVDIQGCCLWRLKPDQREKIDHPLLELVILVYFLNVSPDLLSREMISVKDLKDAHFFQGPHALKTAPLLERYGKDISGFKQAAENMGGEPIDMADVAYKLSPLPKIPLYYLLWEGDEEFQPHLSILFDRSIESHLSADAIWGLVNLVSIRLLMGDSNV